MAETLIDAGADVNTKCEGYSGRTPLGVTVYYDRREIAEMLVDAGADVNSDPDRTLCAAVFYDRKELAQIGIVLF